MSDPIDQCIDNWHAQVRGRFDGGLDALLHPDVVFYSPVVFTPQRGREVTALYLTAAGATIGGGGKPKDRPGPSEDHDAAADSSKAPTGFRYTKEIRQGHQAMLEFETTMDGKVVNGVDIITCDDDSMITEFKVMVRPLQGVQVVHQQMMAMLERLS
jgi:hypothetical protein